VVVEGGVIVAGAAPRVKEDGLVRVEAVETLAGARVERRGGEEAPPATERVAPAGRRAEAPWLTSPRPMCHAASVRAPRWHPHTRGLTR
jgi:hypothetical protein